MTGEETESGGAGGRRTARVVLAEDQTVVREGLVMLLGLLPGIEVVGAAADGEEALRLVAELSPDVVLMDLRMPRLDGVEATRRVRSEYPGTEVVVLTTYDDDDSLFPALRAGARGYLTKDAGGDDIVRAVEAVLSGEAGLAPAVQRRLLERLSTQEPGGSGYSAQGSAGGTGLQSGSGSGLSGLSALPGSSALPPEQRVGGGAEPPGGLTVRETEVLKLVAEGLSNHDIGRRLHISTATVKTHINNLFAKTGVRDRAQAVRYAYQKGIVT